MGVVISANEEGYCIVVVIRLSVFIRREKLWIRRDTFGELCQCRSWSQQLRPVTLKTVTLMVKGAVKVCVETLLGVRKILRSQPSCIVCPLTSHEGYCA